MKECECVSVYTRKHLAERLVIFRDDFKEEIPQRIIHSDELDNKYTVRSGWFLGLASDLEVSKIEGILPNSVIKDVDKFLLWYTDDFGKRTGYPIINTREDIEQANKIINKVLESLGARERKCNFKIIAFVNGIRQADIICNHETGCLSKLVWCGIGVNRSAALILGRSAKGIGAYVEGDCESSTSSDLLQR